MLLIIVSRSHYYENDAPPLTVSSCARKIRFSCGFALKQYYYAPYCDIISLGLCCFEALLLNEALREISSSFTLP